MEIVDLKDFSARARIHYHEGAITIRSSIYPAVFLNAAEVALMMKSGIFSIMCMLFIVPFAQIGEDTSTPPIAPGRIAFDFEEGSNREVYVMNADGSDPQNLTQSPGNDWFGDWSPDGSQIVFHSERDGNDEIYVMNADGTDPQNLTQNSASDYEPVWSPDGTRILFVSNRDNWSGIYVMDADGENVRALTLTPWIDFVVDWSPDGSQILFVSTRDGQYEIYVMDADGGNVRQLTSDPGIDGWPEWSPNGSQILFPSSWGDNMFDIYVVNVEDGSEPLRLTEYGGSSVSNYISVWSPDGTQIAYSSDTDVGTAIFVVNADGTDRRQLTTPTDDSAAYVMAWIPDPDGSQ